MVANYVAFDVIRFLRYIPWAGMCITSAARIHTAFTALCPSRVFGTPAVCLVPGPQRIPMGRLSSRVRPLGDSFLVLFDCE